MVEISEKERKRRVAARDADNKIPAQSFRFGKEIKDKLVRVSRRRDMPQSEVMRELIDNEYDRVFG